jgi:tripartite-type tricarboxylate transporter receptor subunit TctC
MNQHRLAWRRLHRGAAAILAAVVAAAVAGQAAAQPSGGWPTKPVRIVVPFAPGGATDVLGRLLSERLGPRLGQQVVIENKPGAGGSLGAALVAQAPADGHTLFIGSNPGMTSAASLSKDAGFDAVRDFAPIAMLATQAFLLNLHPTVPAGTLREFVAYVKSRPGQLAYASPGVGSPHHLAMELFKLDAGIDMLHVPYRGGGPMTLDVVAGQVPVMFGSYVIAGPHLQSGKLKAVAGSGIKRITQAPDIPTIAEQGYPGFDVTTWLGLFAPAATPAAVVARLAADTHAVLAQAEVKERFLAVGLDPAPVLSSAAFGERLKADVGQWAKVIRDANIKAE